MRLICYNVPWLEGRRLSHTVEAAVVEWMAPKRALEGIHKILVLHGHAGYSDDFPRAPRLRDNVGSALGDGA